MTLTLVVFHNACYRCVCQVSIAKALHAFLLRMVIGNKNPCRNAKSSMLARFVTGDGRNANFRGYARFECIKAPPGPFSNFYGYRMDIPSVSDWSKSTLNFASLYAASILSGQLGGRYLPGLSSHTRSPRWRQQRI